MPTFCRHNRLVQNCPICSREQAVEMRPLVSPQGQTVRAPRPASPARGGDGPARPARSGGGTRSTAGRGTGRSSGLVVRRMTRGADDGYSSRLVPGLRSSVDAERLAEEIAFAANRLRLLAADPPGLYAEVAAGAESLEERTFLAFLISYLSPVEDEQPFASIEQARRPWEPWSEPELAEVALGPRTAHDPARGTTTIDAYRTWARRSGDQATAFSGESAWTPQRRFARLYERLALPGLHRAARFDLLTTLGRLGLYELEAGTLALGGNDPVTLAAKRLLGIGDPMLLERRATELADACAVPLAALDLGLFNWERGERAGVGVDPAAQPDPETLEAARDALGL